MFFRKWFTRNATPTVDEQSNSQSHNSLLSPLKIKESTMFIPPTAPRLVSVQEEDESEDSLISDSDDDDYYKHDISMTTSDFEFGSQNTSSQPNSVFLSNNKSNTEGPVIISGEEELMHHYFEKKSTQKDSSARPHTSPPDHSTDIWDNHNMYQMAYNSDSEMENNKEWGMGKDLLYKPSSPSSKLSNNGETSPKKSLHHNTSMNNLSRLNIDTVKNNTISDIVIVSNEGHPTEVIEDSFNDASSSFNSNLSPLVQPTSLGSVAAESPYSEASVLQRSVSTQSLPATRRQQDLQMNSTANATTAAGQTTFFDSEQISTPRKLANKSKIQHATLMDELMDHDWILQHNHNVVINNDRTYYRQNPFNEVIVMAAHAREVRLLVDVEVDMESCSKLIKVIPPQHSSPYDIPASPASPFKTSPVTFSEHILPQHMHIHMKLKKLIASASEDGNIILWNCFTGEKIHILSGHRLPVTCMVFMNKLFPYSEESEETNYFQMKPILISGSCDRTIKIWDVSTGKCLSTLKAHNAAVRQIVVLDKDRFCSCGNDAHLCIWNTNGECVGTISRAEEENIHGLIVLPNHRVVTASDSKVMHVYNFVSMEVEEHLEGHNESIQCLIKVNDKIFASAALDGTVIIWDCYSLKPLQKLNHFSYVQGNTTHHGKDMEMVQKGFMTKVQHLLAINHRFLAVAVHKGFLVYDMNSGACVLKKENAHNVDIKKLICLHHGNILVSCAEDNSIKFWYTKQRFSEFYEIARVKQEYEKQMRASRRKKEEKRKPDFFKTLKKVIRVGKLSNATQQPQPYKFQRSTNTSSTTSNVATLQQKIIVPRYIGELQLHSAPVCDLLALSQYSFASCGQDGFVFLFKDGRVQKRMRSFLAWEYLKSKQG